MTDTVDLDALLKGSDLKQGMGGEGGGYICFFQKKGFVQYFQRVQRLRRAGLAESTFKAIF